MTGTISNLDILVDRIKPNQTWTVAGIGKWQLPLTEHAIQIGGNVRVGLEDNFYFTKGELAKSNAQFVKRVVEIAKANKREVATVKVAREILGL